jgi:hypothetical protein
MTRHKTATYLYCVVNAARTPSMARIPAGLTGATAPEAHRVAPSLWLIAAEVPLAIYGPPELESRLRDLDWVARAALAHEGVVEHFARSRGATVIPAKLFTMFSSVERTVADVSNRRSAIVRVMKRIAGCEEWGIRITRTAVAAGTPAPADRPSSGSAFLAARKAARDAVVNARAEAAEAATETYRRLARLSRDAAQREKRPEPGTNPPILEAAFLVPVAARARFKAEVAKQAKASAGAGTSLTLTGPWPAYNFIEASS